MMLGLAYSCEDANAFIAEYLEGVLDKQTEAKFSSHVSMCPNCGTFLDQYRHTVNLCKSDGTIEVPEELLEHTLAFLRNELPGV